MLWPFLVFNFQFHTWHLIDNRFWQIESQQIEAPIDMSHGKCGLNQIYVKGQMLQDRDPNPFGAGTVEYLQKTTCTKWINKNFPERCTSFDRDKWLEIKKTLTTKPMEFCIDWEEWPNQKGAYPWVFVSWYEANEICQKDGKRLCSEEEQTFACEGEEGKPYPYGYDRDPEACAIDRKYIAYRPSGLRPRERAGAELDRLWQGEANGASPRCKSDFGVMNLTGNVDEWVTKTRPEGKYKSILRSGYWGRVRNRCRPTTRSHNENHVFYQQGFRCCSSLK